ncbi:MAG TPA: aminotransferase class III-fold pyridoxal phosphate-dependent enzyme [Candidatus Dormibacteraeota bacterium]|jgi:taurine---2-oxoglutarate transaminase|nr:aminotransferase class III-fold pyridoxal phosphate-dependent enzyme [Candidatus Dormibacteraeota bacterium]
MVTETVKALSAEEISDLCVRHTLYDWSAQAGLKPMAIASAQGVHFHTVDGRRFIDFNSQLMCVNAGYGDRRIIDAIKRQAEELAYISPFMATEPRARLGRKLAELLPGDIDKVLFTLGGADANENAIKIARTVTGRPKILARYRSYHGSMGSAMQATGDPRRWPNEFSTGVVHVLDPYHGIQRGTDSAEFALAQLEETIQLEGPQTIAAFILEPITGTNGILIPPDGYLQGVRELCDRFGILLICDEVMTGFGRTGRWFAVDHWNVVPDLITLAKGLTSSYVPLGAVGMRPKVAAYFDDHVFYGGLTYNSHPLLCAAALGAIQAYEEDDMVGNARRMGAVLQRHHEKLQERHPCVGATRSIGLFGALELVRDRRTLEPLAPFNGTSPEMKAIGQALLDAGLYTFVRWNTIMTNPPLCITEAELDEGFEILDTALEIGDQAVGS